MGKTAVAIAVAERLRERGEDPVAVACDAIQVYRGLETLSGAATPAERERLEHRLTGFVESTVNEVVSRRFCKKQQMQWSKAGAHLLLQTRVRTLNGELGAIFKRGIRT